MIVSDPVIPLASWFLWDIPFSLLTRFRRLLNTEVSVYGSVSYGENLGSKIVQKSYKITNWKYVNTQLAEV